VKTITTNMSNELSVQLVTVTALAILQDQNTIRAIARDGAVVTSRHDSFATIKHHSFVKFVNLSNTTWEYGWVKGIDAIPEQLTIERVPSGDLINVNFWNVCASSANEYTKSLFKSGDYVIVTGYVKNAVGYVKNAVGSVAACKWTEDNNKLIGKIFKIAELHGDGDVSLINCPFKYWSPNHLRKATPEEIEKHLEPKELPRERIVPGATVTYVLRVVAPIKVGDCVLCPSVQNDTKLVLWDSTMTQFVGQIGVVDQKHDVKGACIVRFGKVSGVFLEDWLVKVKGTTTEIMKQVVDCMTVKD
jgi:hypothetical protein